MMEWYEQEVRAMEQAHIAHPPTSGAIAFYGSSSMRLWSTLADDFKGVNVLNLGFGGSTLAACVYFFERLVLPCHPGALVFYAGDNDLGDGQSPEQVIGSFNALLQKVDSELGPMPFAFISIKPSPARWHIVDRIKQTNAMIKQRLSTREHSYYVDIFDLMLGSDGLPQRDLFSEDGLHLSAAGYKLWTSILSCYTGEMLKIPYEQRVP